MAATKKAISSAGEKNTESFRSKVSPKRINDKVCILMNKTTLVYPGSACTCRWGLQLWDKQLVPCVTVKHSRHPVNIKKMLCYLPMCKLT